mgnify:CR=1 FL=1
MIVSPDLNGELDGSVVRIASYIEAATDIPILPLTRIHNFKFNPELLTLDKYILLDYCELHWDTKNEDSHLFGKNTASFSNIFEGDEWIKFDEFVKEKPPFFYFKRELKKKDVGGNIFPVDYPCWTNPYPIESKEQFEQRPVNVFYYWGRSHEDRVQLHGDIWKNSSKNGASICDNIYYFNAFMQEEKSINKWVTLNTPHYSRVDISNILTINGVSRLSVSMPGSGVKCFRNSESPVNSIVIFPDDDLAWAYPWVHGQNCIRMSGDPIESIEKALQRKDLYEIYIKGMETIDKYRIGNYVNNYIKPIINNL